jgi:Uma2 family endonuclease
MTTAQKLMTAEELWRLPDDGQRHELIAGELRTTAPSGAEHARISALASTSLNNHVLPRGLGDVLAAEAGFLLTAAPHTVRAPDAAFISRERVAAAGVVTGFWPGAPDLAVEVISPNDLYTEVEEKVADWLAHGTRMVIVINPRRRTVKVHRSATAVRHLTIDDTLDGEDVVPGWALPVRALFARDDEPA